MFIAILVALLLSQTTCAMNETPEKQFEMSIKRCDYTKAVKIWQQNPAWKNTQFAKNMQNQAIYKQISIERKLKKASSCRAMLGVWLLSTHIAKLFTDLGYYTAHPAETSAQFTRLFLDCMINITLPPIVFNFLESKTPSEYSKKLTNAEKIALLFEEKKYT